MSTKFGYNMTSNKLDMAKVHLFFEGPSNKISYNVFFQSNFHILPVGKLESEMSSRLGIFGGEMALRGVASFPEAL
jgi:hypothetical protein